MAWYNKGSRIVGFMPDGKPKEFDSVDEYESAYFDAVYESYNEFFLDYPEDCA